MAWYDLFKPQGGFLLSGPPMTTDDPRADVSKWAEAYGGLPSSPTSTLPALLDPAKWAQAFGQGAPSASLSPQNPTQVYQLPPSVSPDLGNALGALRMGPSSFTPRGDAPADPVTADAPLPPQRPASLGAPVSGDKPAPDAKPAGPQPVASPAKDEGFLQRLMKTLGDNSDQLLYLGAGLASSPNWGEGLMRGMQGANAASAARSKTALEQLKLAREQLALKGQVDWLNKTHGVPIDQAWGIASNPSAMADLFKNQYGKDDTPKVVQTGTDQFGRPTYSAVTSGGVRPLTKDETGTPANPVDPNAPLPPPGVDPVEWSKKRADDEVKKRGEQLDRGRVAGDSVDFLQRAYEAYKKLGERGAIGPMSASGVNRTIGGMFGNESEILRQEYEAAAKNLELMQAQLKMREQGAITENERKILALTLPRLDAADPATGLKTLDEMHKLARREMEAARQARGPSGLPAGVTIRRID